MAKYDLSKLDENFAKAKHEIYEKIEESAAWKVSDSKEIHFTEDYRKEQEGIAQDFIATHIYDEYMRRKRMRAENKIVLDRIKEINTKAIKPKGDDFELGF